jgi:hypothetical protein
MIHFMVTVAIISGIALSSGAIAIGAPAAGPPGTAAPPTNALAPADRYFGRLQMSILGVRNSLRDLALQVAAHPEDGQRVYDKALLVDDALHDWAKKFPNDPWIPKYLRALANLYGQLDTDDARVQRNDTLDWLISAYPTSDYALIGRI